MIPTVLLSNSTRSAVLELLRERGDFSVSVRIAPASPDQVRRHETELREAFNKMEKDERRRMTDDKVGSGAGALLRHNLLLLLLAAILAFAVV